ncbi:EVE domain-containing protein [Paracoccus xiamenensis]|uniref:EVE domain-containing protein n=1 Tax=Paracoccus xiamenensis TaxID=2714901 RepID=UPI0014085C91|nr:EVE domain-containing protein [Paracoccus xiamenensis]NHF71852.1 EVE domain-containing protein [Paracoccus xiamenensis]
MRYWVGTVSREHVLIGVAGGFAMINHGKLTPLQRLSPGDGLVYYSPRTAYPDGAPLKAFTAIGLVRDKDPYPAMMPTGQTGFRRDIDWMTATETPIQPLSEGLEFTRGNWGMLARRGLFEISGVDFQTIRAAMMKD